MLVDTVQGSSPQNQHGSCYRYCTCTQHPSCIMQWYILLHLADSDAGLKVLKQHVLIDLCLYDYFELCLWFWFWITQQHSWELWGCAVWCDSDTAGRKTHSGSAPCKHILSSQYAVDQNELLSWVWMKALFLCQDTENQTVCPLHFHFAGGEGQCQVTPKWIPIWAASETFSDSYNKAQWEK